MKTLTKKQERILAKIQSDKETMKRINASGLRTPEDLLRDGARYVKATKDRSAFCVIYSVSRSGMSRNLAFFQGGKNGVQNFRRLFDILRPAGVTPVQDAWRVSGCGMDMVFHTHYCLIHRLHALGFITKAECDTLAQCTPPTV